ncbi:hypothetical protein VTO73DRAFT_13061 [Trametes versicolor]
MQRLIIFVSSLAVFAQLQLVHIGASAQATTNATCFPSYLEWYHWIGYPERISPNTSVPRWAYLDVQQTGRLDISEAKTIASENQPDATVSGFYDALYPTPSGSGFSPYYGEQFGSESQGPSVGVIVGAAVGGTIGVIAIAAALFFLIRASCRRRRAIRNAAAAPSVPLKECGFDDVALTSAARLYYSPGHAQNPDDPTTYPPFSASTSEKATLQQAGGRAWIDYPAAIPWDSAKMIGKPQDARPAASEPVYPGQPEVTV